MSLTPLFLSPALPSELLTYIISKCTYPTTLIICSTQTDFLLSLTDDIQRQLDSARFQAGPGQAGGNITTTTQASPSSPASDLLTSPLHQVAIARHIRVVFVPTVSHLHAFLSTFCATGGKVTAPPALAPGTQTDSIPLLLTFGFLDLHRDTSEWSAQGLSSTASALVDAAADSRMRAVIIESARRADGEERRGLGWMGESVPLLSSSVRRAVAQGEGWTGRSVEVRRVLGRWFRFSEGKWWRDP